MTTFGLGVAASVAAASYATSVADITPGGV
jgi:hypothetical protein